MIGAQSFRAIEAEDDGFDPCGCNFRKWKKSGRSRSGNSHMITDNYEKRKKMEESGRSVFSCLCKVEGTESPPIKGDSIPLSTAAFSFRSPLGKSRARTGYPEVRRGGLYVTGICADARTAIDTAAGGKVTDRGAIFAHGCGPVIGPMCRHVEARKAALTSKERFL